MALKKLAKIRTAWLVLNYACTNRCLGCYAQSSQFVNQEMPYEDAITIMPIIKDMGVLDCLAIGGEPTLYKHLINLIVAAKNLGIDFKIVTNGRNLSDVAYIKALKDAGLKHASISIEGSTAQTHNLITRTPSFDQVMKGIDNCLFLDVSFNTLLTISKVNFAEIVDLAKMLHEIGVVNILYNIGLPSPESSQNEVDDFILNPIEVANVISEAYIEFKNLGIKAKFFATIPLCLFDDNLLKEMIGADYISNGAHCHIFYGTGIVFEPKGNVLPCTHFVGHPLFNWHSIGIKSSDDFSDVWYGKQGIHGDFKEAIWKYPSQKCVDCQHWGRCVGGCPFLWTHFNPNQIINSKEVS